MYQSVIIFFFFFNDTATTEIYTLSLHDALPISGGPASAADARTLTPRALPLFAGRVVAARDRKSTRLNSSHVRISYAVFCLKKKNRLPKKSPTRPLRIAVSFCCTQGFPAVVFF